MKPIETKEMKMTDKTEETKSKRIPKPCGYSIVLALPEVEKKFSGTDIEKPSDTLMNDQVASVVGFVIAMGPDCYKDEKRFPSGPYCKLGDFVLVGAYRGTRFKIEGTEFRIINDDTPLAIVDDPRGYSRC
jgi:co-chaperonin GroES (HSP10)